MRKQKYIKKRVQDFQVNFFEEKDGKYSVSVPSLPGCFSQGDTLEEAITNIREAIGLYLKDEKELEIPRRNTRKEFAIPVRVSV